MSITLECQASTALDLYCTCVVSLLPLPLQAMALASSPTGPQAPATSGKDASTIPIKTRTEKDDRIVKMLQMSLSEKISEKLSAVAAMKDKEEGSEPPSPCSTVSSSGEVEGVYTLYTDEGTQSSDDDSGGGHVMSHVRVM